VSLWLNRRYYPTPYDWPRIGEYVVVALMGYAGAEWIAEECPSNLGDYLLKAALFVGYMGYLVRREQIDVKALMRAMLKR
ncbi:MAG: hypothetical protein IJ028_04830, partial [Alistipes sp.]|nr:hypothetical protein [Alistipes sp.]